MSGETEQNVSGWTTDTVHELFSRLLREMDLRYQQRFDGQESALLSALAAAQRHYDQQIIDITTQFHEHIQQVRDETQLALNHIREEHRVALDASTKAIDKAEAATEKRFESVNEFRGQLNDQVRTFAPRDFVEQQINTVSVRLDDANKARAIAIADASSTLAGLLPREVYEAAQAAAGREREQIRDRLAAVEGEIKASRRAAAAYVTALGVGFTVLTIVLTFLRP